MVGGLLGGGLVGLGAYAAWPAGAEAPGGPPPGAGGPPPATVKVAEAAMKPLQPRVDVVGRLEASKRAEVSAQVAGNLVEVPVEAGTAVAAHETVLARVDPTIPAQLLREAQAAVREAESAVARRESDVEQLEQIFAARSGSSRELKDARTDLEVARARLAGAVAEQDRRQTDVDRLDVLAPFDGVVVSKMAEVGRWVDPGDALVEVVSRGTIDAVVDVPERLIQRIRAGATAAVTVEAAGEGGAPLEVSGEVFAVTPDGTGPARTFPVKVRLDDRGGRLKAGMSVTASFPAGAPEPTLVVPRDAVLFNPRGAEVWVSLEGEGPGEDPLPMALPVPVEVLFGDGTGFAVEVLGDGPLFPGARVVVMGQEALFPTRPLLIDGPGSPGEPAATPGDAAGAPAAETLGGDA
ncbi:putative efflux system periplasmic linker protein [Phycisphaera mikurensis NBRC 102666]|uniref:Putative efflux system periplasmic linker protein n=1 Tax=Phycisphaera mikurensis (strain NBRC 102666 / KCTC 22515 / FYK2301M01) TaxID=1142394 RepID=I0IFE9_PHYMF|nr:putative efflux system periplasmic linker protein [Phycisphaera mikurensis NBRC 102666]